MTWRANQRTLVVISITMMAFVSPAAAKVIYVDYEITFRPQSMIPTMAIP
ncbi:MAG: hypothetical protein ACYSW7_11980 [Planctomycetota bacterium]|jgi:hypothetical protein